MLRTRRARARVTALISALIFALGAVIIAAGAANEAEGPGVGPFLLLIGVLGLYSALCLAVGKLVLPCQDDACFIVTEERLQSLRPDIRS